MKKVLLVGLIIVLAFAVSGCGTTVKNDKSCGCRKECAVTAESKAPCPSGKYVMRVNCGATESYTDAKGNIWCPDQMMATSKKWGCAYGMSVDRGSLNITGVAAPKVYETECYSMSNYTFTEVPDGKYTVRLHFAETYDGISAVGGRLFDITINGKTIATDYDPYKLGGGPNKPSVKECKGVEVSGGKIVIGFEENIQNPEINGIEIIQEQ